MSTNFYIKSVRVKNFRSFSDLSVKGLKRVNIIGGFNASGKTALLETLFLCMDRKNPVALVTPLIWRNQGQPWAVGLPTLFNSEAKDGDKAIIEFESRDGSDLTTLTYQTVPAHVSISLQAGAASHPNSPQLSYGLSAGSTMGMNADTKRNGNDAEASFVVEAPQGAVGTLYRASSTSLPVASFVSNLTRGSTVENSARLTNIVKNKKKPELIKILNTLQPAIKDIQILQDNGVTTIYAETADGMLPVALLGDGFMNLFAAVLAIMNSEGGVVFMDELDTAIHWSMVKDIWQIFSTLAREHNCQIFATSHSKESINSAAAGIRHAGNDKDLLYIRLNKTAERHLATYYAMDDLSDAETSKIEIR